MYAFANTGFEDLEIPAYVTSIGDSAFWDSKELKSLTFAEGSKLKTIEKNAFTKCPNLKEIVLPDEVDTIGNVAFSAKVSDTDTTAPALEKVTFGAKIPSCGVFQFYRQSKLTTVDLSKCASIPALANQEFKESQSEKITFYFDNEAAMTTFKACTGAYESAKAIFVVLNGGSVTVNNGSTAKKGDTVTITVKPNEGYEIDKVTVTDSKGNTITVTDKGDGKFSFVMPDSKVDVKATFVKSEVKPDQPSKTAFVDVPENSWYADAADFVAQRGLMSGVGENLFGGGQNTTRAMLMTILARMDGQDVTGGATWYEKAMNWAKQTGVSDGTMPEVNITREQLATMLYSYAKLKGVDTTQGGMAVREFNDYDSISAWANQSMAWAVNAGILSGRGNNTLAPTAGATRAEMAVMLQQFVGLMEK